MSFLAHLDQPLDSRKLLAEKKGVVNVTAENRVTM